MSVGIERKSSEPQGEYERFLKPRALRPEDFPAHSDAGEQFRFLLRYGILAPSSNNAQAWKFRLTSSGIEIQGDPERRLPRVDPENRELIIGIGALVFNLRVAASFFGFSVRESRNLDGDIFREAVVTLELVPQDKATGERFTGNAGELLAQIPARHTNREPFLPMKIPGPVLAKIREIALQYEATVVISAVRDVNVRVAQIVSAAERKQFDDLMFRKELASWIRLSGTRRHDGLPGTVLGDNQYPDSKEGGHRTFDISRVFSPKKLNLCIDAPALLVFQSEDNRNGWLETGEMLEHILLTMTGMGLQNSYFNMAIEVPEFRTMIRTMFGLTQSPQMLLRLGYADPVRAVSPRRPLEEFLLSTTTGNPSSIPPGSGFLMNKGRH